MKILRRFEVFVPVHRANGEADPESLLAQAIAEIKAGLPAVPCRTQNVQGIGAEEDSVHRNNYTRVYLDVPDTVENRSFFLDLKEKLKCWQPQFDIFIVSYLVEVL